MKKSIQIKSYLALMILLASLISCSSDAEPNVTVKIDLGRLSRVQNILYNKSLIDRFLCLFARDANAQTAPEGITSIDLTISGPGMTTFTGSYAPDTTTIILAVEAGKSRLFQVVANRPLGNYTGSATVDLVAGTMQTVNISMEPVVPHYTDVIINPSFSASGTFTPSSVTYSVNATADGTTVLSQTFTPGETIQMDSDTGIVFTVTAETPSATLTGTQTIDLTPDATVTVTPAMTPSNTMLVIPDNLNNRIVQIDENFSASSWITKNASDSSSGLYLSSLYITTLSPYDTDFDNNGRIYIAHNGSAEGGIIRIDDINDISPERIISYGFLTALAVDRSNNLIYFANSSQLCRADLDGGNIKTDFDMGTSITNIYGIDITDSGILLIAYSTYFAAYDPNANSGNGAIINYLNYSQGSSPACWDMCAKGTHIYGARTVIYTHEDCIVEFYLNASNQLVQVTDGIYMNGVNSVSLYGPRRFIETLSNRIFFIDDDSSGSTLSVMNDILGTSRVDFDGSAVSDSFQFFNN